MTKALYPQAIMDPLEELFTVKAIYVLVKK
jgi:hypothetical protein